MFNSIKYKGNIKLFGLFKIRNKLDITIELLINEKSPNPDPYLWNSEKIKILEPFLQKICTISWVGENK